MKKRIGILVLIVFSLLLIIPCAFAQTAEDKVQTAIDKAFVGYQSGSDSIFTSTMLASTGTGGEWLTIAAARAGKNYNYSTYLSQLESFVASNLDTVAKRRQATATDLHRIALAIDAAGGDATSFGTDSETTQPINFIADGVYNRHKEENGNKIGTLGDQGTNGFVWGLLALDAKNHTVPSDHAERMYTREQIITAILSTQNADGGFAIYGTDSDNDMTAVTITALAPYYSTNPDVKTAVDRALNLLISQQQPDGAFKNSDFPGFPGAPNSNTTAQVLTALSALGIDCRTDQRFIKNGNTIIDAICRFQKTNGTFAYDSSSLASSGFDFGGEQVLYALVAYHRFANNKRNLFDYGAESGSMTLSVEAGGKIYPIDFAKSQLTYALTLPEEVNEVTFQTIPTSPYESSTTTRNTPVTFVNGTVEFSVTGRYDTVIYSIQKKKQTTKVGLEDGIANLPAVLTEQDLHNVQKLLAEYEALSMEDREKVANYSELQLKYLTYIQGKDLNYVTSGITPEGNRYTWTIRGIDIVAPLAFDTRIVLQSEQQQRIEQSAPNAFIMHFLHAGNLPGKATIEFETRLSDGAYELYFDNGSTGEWLSTVESKDGKTTYSIDHCSDYYLVRSQKQTKTNSSNTGDPNTVWPLLGLLAGALTVIGVVMILKKHA